MEAFNYYILNELKKKNILKIIEKHSIVTITDRLGRIEYVSDCYCNILECEPNQLIGESHKLIRSHLHSGLLYKKLWETIKLGHTWKGILKGESFKGNSFWLDATIIPLKTKKTVKYLALYKDVSELQLEKEQLLEKSNKYEVFIKNIPFQIFYLSKFGKILSTNKNFRTIKVNELTDNYLFDYINPQWHKIIKSKLNEVFRKRVPNQFEVVEIDSDGRDLTYLISISPVFNKRGQLTSAILSLHENKNAVEIINQKSQVS